MSIRSRYLIKNFAVNKCRGGGQASWRWRSWRLPAPQPRRRVICWLRVTTRPLAQRLQVLIPTHLFADRQKADRRVCWQDGRQADRKDCIKEQHTHTGTFTPTPTSTYTYTHTQYAYVLSHTRTHTHRHVRASIHTHTCAHVPTFTHAYNNQHVACYLLSLAADEVI